MTRAFTGFSPHGLAFFEGLAANNCKAWFEAHRHAYEEHLLEPLKALVADLSESMLAIDPLLITVPAVDRTISRIYRDTRFSRDKSPYKTCLWITYRRRIPDWKDSPCFFFELRADTYRYGMGFYNASRETMDNLRRLIEVEPAEFREVVAFLDEQTTFTLEGECYKRPLNPALAGDLQQWHQRRNVYVVSNRTTDGRLFTPGVCDDLREGYALLHPLYELFWRVRR